MICIAFSTALFLIHSPTSISKMDNSANYAEKTYTNSTEAVELTYSATESTNETTVQEKETLDSAIPTFTNLSSQTSRGTDREPSLIVTNTTRTNNNKIEAISVSEDEKLDLNEDQLLDTDAATASDSASISPSEKDTESAVKEDTSDVDNVDLLARLICAEAQGEPYEAKVAVGAVVINRVQSGVWAPTISEVIYQNINGYYQFTPVENGWINKPADSDSIKAAKAALNGDDPTNGAQFYYDDKATNTWILSKPVSVQIGHMFYAF